MTHRPASLVRTMAENTCTDAFVYPIVQGVPPHGPREISPAASGDTTVTVMVTALAPRGVPSAEGATVSGVPATSWVTRVRVSRARGEIGGHHADAEPVLQGDHLDAHGHREVVDTQIAPLLTPTSDIVALTRPAA